MEQPARDSAERDGGDHPDDSALVQNRLDALGQEVASLESQLADRLSRLAILKAKLKGDTTARDEANSKVEVAAAPAHAQPSTDIAATPPPPSNAVSNVNNSGLAPTERVYLHDSYLFHLNSAIILVVHPGASPVPGAAEEPVDRPYVLLDSTVFHPQGGGQPTDSGVLEVTLGETKCTWNVVDVRLQPDGTIKHFLQSPVPDVDGSATAIASAGSTHTLNASLVGKSCRLVVDKHVRMRHAALHTSGHLLANVVEEVAEQSLKGFKGYHFAAGPNVEFNMVDSAVAKRALEDKPGFLAQVNEVIARELDGSCDGEQQERESNKFPEEEHEIVSWVEERPEAEEPLRRIHRTVKVGRFDSEACGGTHLKSVQHLSSVVATKLKVKKGVVKVSYECALGDAMVHTSD